MANGWLGSTSASVRIADARLHHSSQRPRCVLGHRIPGEERDGVRRQRRRQLFLVAQHGQDTRAIAGTQGEDLAGFPGSASATLCEPLD